jgi:glycosyltransferase involved in cell wall biosynthesis
MILLFTHDHIIYKYENEFYSPGGLSSETLQRYKKISDILYVATRQKEINNNQNMTPIIVQGINFFKIEDFKSPIKILNYFSAKKQIRKLVMKTDVVVSRMPSSIGIMSITEATKQKKPYLIELVTCPWDSHWNHSLKGKIIAPYMYLKTKTLIKNAKYVVYVTNDFLQKRYPTKGLNVSCSNVSLPSVDNLLLKARLEKINNKSIDEKIKIGTIGAINVRHKGQKYIIRSLGKLKKKGFTNYEYHLVGGGETDYLKKYAKKYDVEDQIKFIGTIEHSNIFKWFETIDIYSQPSKQEGLPRALIEAMSVGIPCFGAKTAGIPELLDEEVVFEFKFNYVDQIINIIHKFNNKKFSLEKAEKNFLEAKKYEAIIIEKRRSEFFQKFIKVEGEIKIDK